jgi:hypothetical protein
MITEKCGCDPSPGVKYCYQFAEYEIPQFGKVGLPWGAYIGLLLQTWLFKGRSHFQGPMHRKNLKLLGRFCLLFGFAWLSEYAIAHIDNNGSFYSQLFLKYFIPMAIFGLLVLGFMDELFLCLHLYEPDRLNASVLITDTNPFTSYNIKDIPPPSHM